jgi:tetratricopeptide (TPR) repeat protein
MSFRWGGLKKRIPQSSAMSSVRPRVKGAPPWTVGDKIKGKFEVLQILGGPGRSGMGIVYIVVDRESNAIFAAKTLQDWCFRDQKSVARFEREAKMWTDLEKHPNIVRAFFVERIEGRPYIFLEYVPGQDLSMRLKQEKQDIRLCIIHAIQICRAMIHAKSKIPGFLHRDIKPGNCLITPEGTLKMTDFGLSKTVLTVDEVMRVYDNEKEGDYPDITREGRRAGTLPYMAPEQFTSVHPINERSDIYSFGVTLFRMCTGRMPFEGKSAKDWMFHHIFTKPNDPCSYSNRIPPDLRAIILKCLSKRQDERFESFEEIETMLEHVLWKCFGERVTMVDEGQMEVWELCNKGLSYDRLGRSQEALDFYNRALAIAPADATALCNKGVALDNLGRASEALECYRAALRLNPDLAEAWTNMGILLDTMGDSQEALQCYDRAIDVNPRYIDAWMKRGATVAAMGRLSEALDCFDTALEISPEFAGGWLTRGAALLELGLPAEALSSFNRSLSLDENFVEAWNGKGTALALLERYEKALRCFQRSLELASSNVDALRGLGNVFLNLNRLEDALDCFQEVLAINPDDLEALGGEGAVLAAMGREGEALERFDQILRLPHGRGNVEAQGLHARGHEEARGGPLRRREGRADSARRPGGLEEEGHDPGQPRPDGACPESMRQGDRLLAGRLRGLGDQGRSLQRHRRHQGGHPLLRPGHQHQSQPAKVLGQQGPLPSQDGKACRRGGVLQDRPGPGPGSDHRGGVTIFISRRCRRRRQRRP